jgi:hypothetical protein
MVELIKLSEANFAQRFFLQLNRLANKCWLMMKLGLISQLELHYKTHPFVALMIKQIEINFFEILAVLSSKLEIKTFISGSMWLYSWELLDAQTWANAEINLEWKENTHTGWQFSSEWDSEYLNGIISDYVLRTLNELSKNSSISVIFKVTLKTDSYWGTSTF